MLKLVFATNNSNKLAEIRSLVGDKYEILGLKDIGSDVDIPETADTLEGNALLKAQYVKEHFGYDCFADDTGLEIKALDNAPGVYSARYAGESRSAEDNMDKVLKELDGVEERSAQFRTVIAYTKGNEEILFEGIVEGSIRKEKSGSTGFGYDPIFEPKGYDVTFAEMTMAQKNDISHRARAMKKFIEFLKGE